MTKKLSVKARSSSNNKVNVRVNVQAPTPARRRAATRRAPTSIQPVMHLPPQRIIHESFNTNHINPTNIEPLGIQIPHRPVVPTPGPVYTPSDLGQDIDALSEMNVGSNVVEPIRNFFRKKETMSIEHRQKLLLREPVAADNLHPRPLLELMPPNTGIIPHVPPHVPVPHVPLRITHPPPPLLLMPPPEAPPEAPPTPIPPRKDYTGWTKSQLKSHIKQRNNGVLPRGFTRLNAADLKMEAKKYV